MLHCAISSVTDALYVEYSNDVYEITAHVSDSAVPCDKSLTLKQNIVASISAGSEETELKIDCGHDIKVNYNNSNAVCRLSTRPTKLLSYVSHHRPTPATNLFKNLDENSNSDKIKMDGSHFSGVVSLGEFQKQSLPILVKRNGVKTKE